MASLEHTQKFCSTCNEQTLAQRPGTNHILHLILSVITGGIWLLVWIGVSVKVGGWRCGKCGGTSFGARRIASSHAAAAASTSDLWK